MGKSRWFFSFSGVILLVGAIAIATLGINFGIDFESGTRITTPLEQAGERGRRARRRSRRSATATRRSRRSTTRSWATNVVQISVPQLDPSEVDEVEQALDDDFGVAADDFSASSIGPTFGEQIARTALIAVIASLLLISIYIGFRFEFKFAVPVLIALAHDLLITARRVRPVRPGGDDVDGRGAAHHHGLLALRHGHRVRPNTRERAAHAARDLLADRQPLDVRGVHPIAGHQLRAC